MRHLKSYKLFETVLVDTDEWWEDVGVDIDNIIRECEDLGLDTIIFPQSEIYIELRGGEIKVEGIKVLIEHNPPLDSKIVFEYKDIKDSVNHLIEYMNQLGYPDFLYQDKYTEFNYEPYIARHNYTPNLLPKDNEAIAVIQIIFYKPITKNQFT